VLRLSLAFDKGGFCVEPPNSQKRKSMRFIHADPDIATVYNRIQQHEINLQPDFQRGEVWPPAKKQRLIDSILRGWIVPPILVIDDMKGGQLQVLDGQQRLAAIRDFKENQLIIDGSTEPLDEQIQRLDGLRYRDLPIEVRRTFDRTTIRLFHVTDFSPEEPAEIFFRLNQPTALTSAEKRNAFFGPVRTQVRELVDELEQHDAVQHLFGFSNSRMAYDDLLARFVCVLENRSLTKKVTAGAIDLLYRRKEPIGAFLEARLQSTVSLVVKVVTRAAEMLGDSKSKPKLNKATALSWFIFFARLDAVGDIEQLAQHFLHFELLRQGVAEATAIDTNRYAENSAGLLLVVYNDRATSRVADASSVILRDVVLWHSWYHFTSGNAAGSLEPQYDTLITLTQRLLHTPPSRCDEEILSFASATNWGAEI
jgi:hypothetical protein